MIKNRTIRVLTEMEATFEQKETLYATLKGVKSIKEYQEWLDSTPILSLYRGILTELIF